MCVVSGGRSLEGCLRFQDNGLFGHGMLGGYKDRNAKKSVNGDMSRYVDVRHYNLCILSTGREHPISYTDWLHESAVNDLIHTLIHMFKLFSSASFISDFNRKKPLFQGWTVNIASVRGTEEVVHFMDFWSLPHEPLGLSLPTFFQIFQHQILNGLADPRWSFSTFSTDHSGQIIAVWEVGNHFS